MDYGAEQQMELEALEAIYADELQPYDGTLPSGWDAVGNTYIMTIRPDEDGEGEQPDSGEELQMEMLWAHTPQYPDQPPNLKLQAVYGLTDREVAQCAAALQEQVQQNLGMAMIYTLITAAKDWLRDRASHTAQEDPEAAAKKAADLEEAARQAARAHGHPVTIDAFMAWRAQFAAEQAVLKAKALEGVKDDDKAKRMTGKAWFMQDRADDATEAGALSEDDDEAFGAEDGGKGGDGEGYDVDDDDDDLQLGSEDFEDEDEEFLNELG